MLNVNLGLLTYDFYPPIGGQGVEAHELYRVLRQDDGAIRPIVFSASHNDLDDHVSVPSGSGSGANLRFSFTANRLLPRWIRRHQLDAVQAYGGPGGTFLVRKPSVPLVYVANHTYSLQRHHIRDLPVYRALQKIEARGYGMATRIVAISSTTADNLCKAYGVPEERIEVIPPGIDCDRLTPVDVPRDPYLILYVGRLDKRKGLDYLLRAFQLLREELPQARLIIAGTGPLAAELRATANSLGVTEAVEFAGKVSNDTLLSLYRRAAVFVLPSLFEGFGIVLAEAMACGTPIVATRVPGVVDVVKPWEGELVPPADAAGLAEAIQAVLSDSGRAHTRARQARARVLKEFSIETVGERFRYLYARLGRGL